MVKDFIIVGAGLSGLHAALTIDQLKLGNSLIVEKSRGIGGRMATRRTLGTRFDHGAQFYRLKNDILPLHENWTALGVNSSWFQSSHGDHWCAPLGMTSLAKVHAHASNIALEKQISSISFENGMWSIVSDKNEHWQCQKLILSSPLPQSIKLLETIPNEENVNLEKLTQLKKIDYTKALIALITMNNEFMINSHGYEEFESGDFFSIADQKSKGVSEISAFTITMSAEFSENHFEFSDDVILSKIQQSLSQHFPNISIKEIELKKWRYCKPKTQDDQLFCEIARNLFLVGDAFGGSSLLGAVRSAEALCQHLQQRG